MREGWDNLKAVARQPCYVEYAAGKRELRK